jgi:hypothetical protein
MKRVQYLAALGLLGALLAASSAQADPVTYTYTLSQNLSGGTNADTGIQFKFDVTDLGGGQVNFRFYNDGPVASSITQIYFDDLTSDGINPEWRVLDQIVSLSGSAGVLYGIDDTANLPAGQNAVPKFSVTMEPPLAADPASPTQPNGINPGEELNIVFALTGTATFMDVITQLNNGVTDPYTSPALRVGIHVQGYTTGTDSESFIGGTLGEPKTPPDAPLPPVAIAGIALMGGFGGLRRLRKRVCAA